MDYEGDGEIEKKEERERVRNRKIKREREEKRERARVHTSTTECCLWVKMCTMCNDFKPKIKVIVEIYEKSQPKAEMQYKRNEEREKEREIWKGKERKMYINNRYMP